MLNFLVELLGGVTREDYLKKSLETNMLRNRLAILQKQLKMAKDNLDMALAEPEEVKQLINVHDIDNKTTSRKD